MFGLFSHFCLFECATSSEGVCVSKCENVNIDRCESNLCRCMYSYVLYVLFLDWRGGVSHLLRPQVAPLHSCGVTVCGGGVRREGNGRV